MDRNKNVTALVRSMKRALKTDHGSDVPHAALRAAYLVAQGEHPHAFAGNHPKAATADSVPTTRSQAAGSALLVRSLYIPHGSRIGEILSLDADGRACLPLDPLLQRFGLQGSIRVIKVTDAHPRGPAGASSPQALPTADSQHFFPLVMGLPVAPDCQVGYGDTDRCRVEIEVAPAEWERLVGAALLHNASFADAVAEWVGLHYGAHFPSLSPGQRVEWVERYLESWHSDEPADLPENECTDDEVDADAELVERTLHLVDDDWGQLRELALDEEGWATLATSADHGWVFSIQAPSARVVRVSAQVPSVRRYGLPEFVDAPRDFFGDIFDLGLATDYAQTVQDLGDDSGAAGQVTIRLPRGEWKALVRFVSTHFTLPALEFVFPDEDGLTVPVTVSRQTGVVQPLEPLTSELTMTAVTGVRVRLRSQRGGTDREYEVCFDRATRGWHLTPNALKEFIRNE